MKFFRVFVLVVLATITAAINNRIHPTQATQASLEDFAQIANPYPAIDVKVEEKPGEKKVGYIRGSTQKICQVTGDYDRERRQPTLSRSESRFGVVGTDLGSSFEHEHKLYFLFGDTNGHASPTGADSIAYSTDVDPERCLDLQFLTDTAGHFRPLTVRGVSLGFFEVPTAGFSAHGMMYVFFMTDHPRADSPGRSVLARSDDGGRTFKLLYDISRSKFIEFAPVQVNNAEIPGLPRSEGQGLLLWATGQYRRSPPYLAYVPLEEVEDRTAWKFFAGLQDGQPRWSASEADAGALFNQPCMGEFSVERNKFLNKWTMLYNCNNPRGINLRTADRPWGQWSETQVIFNPRVEDGYCFFMHISYLQRQCDSISDPDQEFVSGGEYAPSIISRFTTGNAVETTIYYLMSSWNPYNVVLMKSVLRVE